MKHLVSAVAVSAALVLGAGVAQAQTLDAVKSKGVLTCGVSQGLAGFSIPNDKGEWSGIDVDVCRAVAAAIFGDAGKVRYTPLTGKDRFPAIQSGEVDVLSRNTTWTMSRDTSLRLNFAPVVYYDGQGFMVRKTLKVASAKELNGASICTQSGTTTELNAADFFRSNNMKYEIVTFASNDEVVKAYESGRCDAFTTDASGLYAEKVKLSKPDDHIVLPEIISKEPLAPAVRQGDDQWLDLVSWTIRAMVNAEELGVTSKNVDEMLKSTNPEIKRLLGVEGDFGKDIGVSKDWAYKIIKSVGNYGEIFDRNVGTGSRLGIARGINALWNKGGLQYAPPIR